MGTLVPFDTDHPLTLFLGVRDTELEGRLFAELTTGASGTALPLRVVSRCLDATELVNRCGYLFERGEQPPAHIALLATDFPRLTQETIATLAQYRVATVLLDTARRNPGNTASGELLARLTLPASLSPAQVRRRLEQVAQEGGGAPTPGSAAPPVRPSPPASRGTDSPLAESPSHLERQEQEDQVERFQGQPEIDRNETDYEAPESSATRGKVIALLGGRGGPGASTLALNLALAFAVLRNGTQHVLLLDGDLANPSLGTALNLDPRRTLFSLAHAKPETATAWTRLLEEEVQPLGPTCHVLGGLPRTISPQQITTTFLHRVLNRCRADYATILIDCGSVTGAWEGTGSAVTRVQQAVLHDADQVLIVLRPDLLGLSQGKELLQTLTEEPGIPAARLRVIASPYSPRLHHRLEELGQALGQPFFAAIPLDTRRAILSLQAQQPLLQAFPHAQVSQSYLALAAQLEGLSLARPWYFRVVTRITRILHPAGARGNETAPFAERSNRTDPATAQRDPVPARLRRKEAEISPGKSFPEIREVQRGGKP